MNGLTAVAVLLAMLQAERASPGGMHESAVTHAVAQASACASGTGHTALPLPREDRFRHFWASYGATAMTFGGVRALDRDAAMPVAIGVAAALGVAKEVHDWRRGGPFDLLDIAADALGIAAAYFFLREIR